MLRSPPSGFPFPYVTVDAQKRSFQKQWLNEFTWLAYSNIYNGAFCKWCVVFAPQTVSRSAKPPGHGHRKGEHAPLGFENISKKRLFFQFRGVKVKFHHFWPPPGKKFGKILHLPPVEKILPTPMLLAH